MWDVLASCDIKGADDGSIRNPEANDMRLITESADIRAIFTTGGKATKLYEKMCEPVCGISAQGLPSTSPANCRCSMDQTVPRILENIEVSVGVMVSYCSLSF